MTKNAEFDKALERFLDAISNRKLEVYKEYITTGETLYTIVQNGYAFKTPEELISMHEEWFKDEQWTWKGSVIHKLVGEDMAMALIRYEYQAQKEEKAFETWLTYVFQKEDGKWRVVHDQNTALDYHAFAKSAGIES